MYFSGIGTAAPATRYTQAQCFEALQGSPQFSRLARGSRALLKRLLLSDNGIDTRALALDPLTEAFDAEPDVLQARFERHAPAVALDAATKALADAGTRAERIDAVVVSTCTGYLCPGLSSYVIERLGLRSDVIALDLVGQGCGAALPNLRTAQALLAAGACEHVLSVCVEICSAAFYIDDDPGVLVSACLFGDGAGAAVLTRKPPASRPVLEWKAAATCTDPLERDTLRFEHRDGMLRNILQPQVPVLAAQYAARVLDGALAERGLDRARIATWVWHAGGRKVLEALERQLGLDRGQFAYSAQVLRQYGNVSSACVYFVLEAALANGSKPGLWWMSAFGAGFSCHGALLERRVA